MFWLPETRTVSKWEMKKLRRLRVNDEEYKRLARAERVAVAGAVIFSDFKVHYITSEFVNNMASFSSRTESSAWKKEMTSTRWPMCRSWILRVRKFAFIGMITQRLRTLLLRELRRSFLRSTCQEPRSLSTRNCVASIGSSTYLKTCWLPIVDACEAWTPPCKELRLNKTSQRLQRTTSERWGKTRKWCRTLLLWQTGRNYIKSSFTHLSS